MLWIMVVADHRASAWPMSKSRIFDHRGAWIAADGGDQRDALGVLGDAAQNRRCAAHAIELGILRTGLHGPLQRQARRVGPLVEVHRQERRAAQVAADEAADRLHHRLHRRHCLVLEGQVRVFDAG
jgi:hypothetical protein